MVMRNIILLLLCTIAFTSVVAAENAPDSTLFSDTLSIGEELEQSGAFESVAEVPDSVVTDHAVDERGDTTPDEVDTGGFLRYLYPVLVTLAVGTATFLLFIVRSS